eukprot:GEMP01047565.1.p1 GENE.GEMP01047565.1~~GEMP01047565.1.p1  ORF type:complete len:416 (+),score=72.78 GEMP01047565.1:178-1425(+)
MFFAVRRIIAKVPHAVGFCSVPLFVAKVDWKCMAEHFIPQKTALCETADTSSAAAFNEKVLVLKKAAPRILPTRKDSTGGDNAVSLETVHEEKYETIPIIREESIIKLTDPPPSLLRIIGGGISWTALIGIWILSIVAPLGLAFVGRRLAVQGRFRALTLSTVIVAALQQLAPHVPTLPEGVRENIARSLRSWFPSCERHYFPLPDRGLYCVHPHGIFTIGAIVLVSDLAAKSTEAITILGAPFVAKCMPLFVMFAKLLNVEIVTARKKQILDLMKRGKTLVLAPGGVQELSLMARGVERVYLNERKAFIALALRNGYTLIPTYSLGEVDTYYAIRGKESWRFHANRFDIPTVVFWGFSLCPFIPRRVPLTVIVGPPLALPCIPSTPAKVAQHHARYIATLRKTLSFYGRDLEVW